MCGLIIRSGKGCSRAVATVSRAVSARFSSFKPFTSNESLPTEKSTSHWSAGDSSYNHRRVNAFVGHNFPDFIGKFPVFFGEGRESGRFERRVDATIWSTQMCEMLVSVTGSYLL